jgi:hypothetical protein
MSAGKLKVKTEPCPNRKALLFSLYRAEAAPTRDAPFSPEPK